MSRAEFSHRKQALCISLIISPATGKVKTWVVRSKRNWTMHLLEF